VSAATTTTSSTTPGALASQPAAAHDGRLMAAAGNDQSAFRAVYERHVGAIHRYIAGRLGPDAADDITAEVFATAYQRRQRYSRERADARPWLYGIATNLMRRQRRAEARRLRALAAAAAHSQPDHVPGPDAASQSDGLEPALHAALAGLGVRDREVLLLAALGDLRPGELHLALGVSPGAARVRLNRARSRLRARLDKETR
jgi:RNA polymerase sigma-70 factor (ECF subfamily)